MSASKAKFATVEPGGAVELKSVFEASWHDVSVRVIDGGDEIFDATYDQYLIYVLNGRGEVSWNGESLEVSSGSALGVPRGERITISAVGSAPCHVAAVRLAGE